MNNLQKQPNRWSCLLTSFAMTLNIDQNDLISEIGHDGSEIVWPDLSDPFCRRSFHIQEMIDCAYNRGFSVIPIDAHPTSSVSPEIFLKLINKILDNAIKENSITINGLHNIKWNLKEMFSTYQSPTISNRFENYLINNKGVLIGEALSGSPHAVAWNGSEIYDPNGTVYGIDGFIIETFYLVK